MAGEMAETTAFELADWSDSAKDGERVDSMEAARVAATAQWTAERDWSWADGSELCGD